MCVDMSLPAWGSLNVSIAIWRKKSLSNKQTNEQVLFETAFSPAQNLELAPRIAIDTERGHKMSCPPACCGSPVLADKLQGCCGSATAAPRKERR